MAVSFSIIIPVYNTERYLKTCIDTLIIQLQKDDEVVLINDGSTDNSGKICTEIVNQNEKNFRYIQQQNRGLSATRNVGIKKAQKEYLLFIDSDDEVKQDYLSVLREKLTERNDIDVLMFGYETFPNGRVFYPGFSEGIKKTQYELFSGNQSINRNNDFSFSWRFAIRRSYIMSKNLFFDEDVFLGEDYLFNAKVLLSGGLVYVMRKSLYRYRIDNNESIMRKKIKPDLEARLSVQYTKKLEIIEQYGLHSVPGWDFDFSWYYITAFRDMLLRNLYNSSEQDKIKGLRRILSLPLISDNYRIIGTRYWKYSKRAALFHFCCKHRVFLQYIDYKMWKKI